MKYMVDPPSGHRYGFPKVYDEEENEGGLIEFLINNGYPRELAEPGDNLFVRMWEAEEYEYNYY